MPRKISLKASYPIACLILAMLSGCSGTREVSDKDWQKEADLKESVRRIQVGIEHYAADHGSDKYPTSLEEMKSYLPGGVEGSEPAAFGPINPFSGSNEFPTVNNTITDVHAARFGKRFPLKPGEVLYCPIDNGKAYAITAGGYDGSSLPDDKNPGQVLILSNIDD